jgi:hypothetical protein
MSSKPASIVSRRVRSSRVASRKVFAAVIASANAATRRCGVSGSSELAAGDGRKNPPPTRSE